MIAYLAQAVGSPTPTLVIDAGPLPTTEALLRPVLTTVRRWLADHDQAHVLKFALVRPSEHPMFDLDYLFVQGLPDGPDQFDFAGSCGHSILSSVLAADTLGWLPRLAPGSRARVRVLNNGDHVVCEVDEARRGSGSFTVHFLQPAGTVLQRRLLTGEASDTLVTPAGTYEVSLVTTGNPYVFVDAISLGLTTREALFEAGDDTYRAMLMIREAAIELLGWPKESVFPKIAAVGSYQPGRIAVRAISVPSWHPTLALTGATCLATATAIEGTIPARLLDAAADDERHAFTIDTPGGTTHVAASLCSTAHAATLDWVSVSGKHAHLHGPAKITSLSDYAYQEEKPAWQPLSA
ncbi:PrpF domain-containing protein [Streptomyces sp. NBC_00212]|uniref:PrpF domain-containing protein n=1 Tax=Streptomyces sp. NBC_00212 TaxID=2975684 RepID=UPI002F90C21A